MKCFLLLVVGSIFLVGCGSHTKIDPEAAPLYGTIDKSLPENKQAFQSAFDKLLRAFQDGVTEDSDLMFSAGNIQLDGGVKGFLGTNKRLIRWNFVGQPTDDSITVSLVFDGSEFGPVDKNTEKKEDRTYSIYDNGSGYSVARLK